MKTKIKLLLEEQFDQDLHSLPFCLHLLDAALHCKTKHFFIFRTASVISLVGPPIFRQFMVF